MEVTPHRNTVLAKARMTAKAEFATRFAEFRKELTVLMERYRISAMEDTYWSGQVGEWHVSGQDGYWEAHRTSGPPWR